MIPLIIFIFGELGPVLDLTLHGQWHICQARRQPPCSGRFDWLGHHPSLVNRMVATRVEVEKARCQNCPSKLCLSFEAAVQESQL